jgi:hypothetical protein
MIDLRAWNGTYTCSTVHIHGLLGATNTVVNCSGTSV